MESRRGREDNMAPSTVSELGFGTHYKIDCIRNGEVVWTENVDNLVVNTGLGYAMTCIFGDHREEPDPLYMGLCLNANSQPTDTAEDHLFIEFLGTTSVYRPLAIFEDGGITEDNRYLYIATDVQTMITLTDELQGVFLTTEREKGSDTGTLYGVAAFPTVREIESGDALLTTITVSAKG